MKLCVDRWVSQRLSHTNTQSNPGVSKCIVRVWSWCCGQWCPSCRVSYTGALHSSGFVMSASLLPTPALPTLMSAEPVWEACFHMLSYVSHCFICSLIDLSSSLVSCWPWVRAAPLPALFHSSVSPPAAHSSSSCNVSANLLFDIS